MKNQPLPGLTSVRDFLAEVASTDGIYGTVSSAAVAGGLGCSLLLMVATLPRGRSDSSHERTKLLEAAAALSEVQEQLIETIETETAVTLFAARNLPQASDTQRVERQAAIQLALHAAADVPLEVMRLCARGLKMGEIVAARGTRAAGPDVQLGVALLHAAFSGARSNLETKLSGLSDSAYITTVVDEIARLAEEAATAADAAQSFAQPPPA